MAAGFKSAGMENIHIQKSSDGLTEAELNLIIDMAWADEISFDAIEAQTGQGEQQVIRLMRRHLKASSFRLWRARVSGRKAKHDKRKRPIKSAQKQWRDAAEDQS